MSSLFESQILKYPRTFHLEGSRLQPGDEGMGGIPIARLRGRNVVFEEKMEGRNCAFRFDGAGQPYGQSRGHYFDLYDRNTNKAFNLFKDWLLCHQDAFLDRFEDRYIVYGEWLGISNTIFYDRLPHFFMEFDVYDLERQCFLDTPARQSLLEGLPIVSVPILKPPPRLDLASIQGLIKQSLYKSETWPKAMRQACARAGDDFEKRWGKIDQSALAEGVYVKVEENGEVVERYKFVRWDFLQCVLEQDEHHEDRLMVPNVLADGVDLFYQPTQSFRM
jgi:hypothetical protein